MRAYGRLPLAFEKNVGRSDGQVRFLSRGAGYALFITDTETVAVLRKHRPHTPSLLPKRAKGNEYDPPAVIRMQLAGANEHPRIEGEEELPGKSNYFIGNDPSKWRTNVPQFAKVRMTDVYRGIDVVYYGISSNSNTTSSFVPVRIRGRSGFCSEEPRGSRSMRRATWLCM